MNLAIAELVMRFLKGIGLIRDPEQEERERQSLRASLAAFWTSTQSPLYAIPRLFIIFGAIWDVFFNDSQRWAAAVRNLSAQGWAGFLELLPVFWLFAGPETLELLRDVYKSRRGNDNAPILPGNPGDGPSVPERPSERTGRARDDDR